MKERLEEKPVSIFPDTYGKGRGRGQIEINPNCNVVGERWGVMNPPIGERRG